MSRQILPPPALSPEAIQEFLDGFEPLFQLLGRGRRDEPAVAPSEGLAPVQGLLDRAISLAAILEGQRDRLRACIHASDTRLAAEPLQAVHGEQGSQLVLTQDSLSAAVHAADQGYIMREAVDEVRDERRLDERAASVKE